METNNNFGSNIHDEGLPNPVDHVITKFVSRGLDKLSLEELAITLITPDFSTTLKKRTGSDWNARLQVKVIERLTKANFDIQWMTRHTSDPNHPFFVACSRGDIDKAVEFIRKSNEDLRQAIDPSLKTGLHFAAREGHIALVEVLIQKGFNVNARDRTLKTPLHYACLQGHETIADVLLKNKADITAKDSSGRTAFHFACCSVSSRLITLLLGTKPELVNLTDNVGRTGLHYSVWNSSQRQVDIIRTVIENKGDVNFLDEEGKTPLHHASEGGRSRAIPILLQKGADITIREFKNGKTPLDLAPSDNIRQLIVVYSAPPFKVKDDDLRWMDQAIRGEKPKVKSDSDKENLKLRNYEEKRPEDKMVIATFLRDKLYTILKDIQEYGVQNAQHIKRPYLFTGSWMEGVSNLEDLYEKISAVTPLEATIRIFNIFYPYDKPYPEPKGEEPIKSSFYGDVWNFEGAILKDNTNVGEINRTRENEEIKKMSIALDIANKKLEDKEDEVARLNKENEVLKRQLEEFNSKLTKAKQSEKLAADIKKQLTTKDDELIELKAKIRELNLQIQEQNIELEALQGAQADEGIQEELDKALDRVAELEKEISLVKEREKAIRFKSGQAFLAALDSKQKQNVPTREIDLNLRDDRAIVKMYRALKDNPPNLEDRLKLQDKDGDGKLNRAEFTKVFENLKLSPKDILSLLRVAGFYGGKELVGISEFIRILEERPKAREKWEEALFFKLLDHFREKNINIDNAFQIMDTSGDGTLNMAELQEGLAKFDIKITDKDAYALFDIFDESDDGMIQLEEFRAVLHEYEQLQFNQIDTEKPPIKEELQTPILDVVSSDDYTLIQGELKLQIPSSKGIDPKTFPELYLKFYLLGATVSKIVKSVKLTPDEKGSVKWNIVFKIPIIQILRENLYDRIWLKIFTNEFQENEENYFGEIELDWKKSLNIPEQWAINADYPLSNKSFPKKKVEGSILVQGKWVPSTSEAFKSTNFSKKDITAEFFSPISDEGFLEILLVTTINCWYHEDVFCDLVFPNNTKKSFKAKFNKDGDAYWNEKHVVELRVNRDASLTNIQCNLYNKSGTLGKTNLLGTLFLDWEECLRYPGESNPIHVYLVGTVPKTGKFCKLYVKTKWISKSSQDLANIPQSKQSQEEIKKQNIEAGLLKLNIVRAQKLLADDGKTSDPMCQVTFNGVEKITEKTEVIKETLNPQWNKHFELPIKFMKDATIPPLDFLIYDWDYFGNDLIGKLSIDWTEAYRNPVTWAINRKYKVENPDSDKFRGRNDFGEIYLQIYYVPPGMFDPNLKPQDMDISKEEQIAVQNKVKGTIVMQVVHAKDLNNGEKGKLVDSLVVVTFPNGKKIESDTVKGTINPIWKKKMSVPIDINKQDNKPIVVEVKDDKWITNDKRLSFVNVNWEECIKKPGIWVINQVFKLTGSPDLQQKYKTQDFGDIYIQVKFIEEGMIDDNKEAQVVEDIAMNGTIFINLIFGKGLRIADKDFSDPYCEIQFPNKTKLSTKTIYNTLNPVWNFQEKVPIKIPVEKYKPIIFDLFDNDGPLMTDDVLGHLELDWKNCFESPGKWIVDDLYELSGPEEIKREKNLVSFGQIYVQMMFLKEGQLDSDPVPSVKFNLDTFLKEQEERMKEAIIGKIFVNVIYGKGLAIGDETSSDSFCRVIFPNGNKVKSSVMKENLNPLWNFKTENHINILQKKMQPIKIDVWDQDSFLNSNDLLGYVQIDWQKCINENGKWAINEIFPVQAPPETSIVPENNKWGELYVQVKFLKDGTQDDPKEPLILYNLEEMLKVESEPIEGSLSIRVIHAKGIPITDSLAEGGLSDPFVRIIIPETKVQQTGVSANNLNPIWNYKLDLPVTIPKNKIKPIRFEVWDKDSMTGDDKIGVVKVSLQDCINQSGKWHINEIFKIEPFEPLKEKQSPPNLGELYIQVMFTNKGDIPDQNPPKLLQDLKILLESEQAPIEGQLFVNIHHAKNLYANDGGVSSDPFCKVLIQGITKLETNYIKKDLNPIWKYKGSTKISLPKNRVSNLEIEVWDHDLMRNDRIGYLEFPLLDILTSPGQWKLNGLYDLKIPKGMEPEKAVKGLGQIYLQVRFLSNEMQNDGIDPTVTDDIENQLEKKKEKIEGTLYVNVIHAKDLLPVDDDSSTSDPFVKVTFGQKTIQSKYIKKTLNPIWNFKGNKIPFSVLKEDIPPLIINVFDHNLLSTPLIGMKEINISEEVLQNPGTWSVNKLYKLTGPLHLIKKHGPNAFGEIYLQMKYLPLGKEDTDPEPNLIEDLDEILKREKELTKGELKLNVLHAKGLAKEDKKNKEIEAMFKINIPTLKEVKSSTAKAGDKPIWDFKKTFGIAIPKNNQENIRIEVYHHRTLLFSNVLLGYVTVNFQDLLNNSGKWIINGNYKLIGPEDLKKKPEFAEGFGEIYLQGRFLKEGEVDDGQIPIVSEDIQSIIAAENEAVKGTLRIHVVHAKKLYPGKEIDPYCKVLLDKTQIGKTDAKKKNSNPIWKKELTQSINLSRQALRTAKLSFEISDENFLSDDKLGFIQLDLSEIVDLQGSWYNQIKKLEGTDKARLQVGPAGLGEIYLQIKFIKEGETEKDSSYPQFLENLEETLQKENQPIKGKLKVHCVHAKDVIISDTWVQGGKSDPYCKVTFPGGKSLETGVVPKNTTAVWKQVLAQDINIAKSAMVPLKIEVYDEDSMKTDELLGFINVDWRICLENPGKWAINEIRKLDGPENLVKSKKHPNGFGTIHFQIQFIPEGMNDSGQMINLIEDLGPSNIKK